MEYSFEAIIASRGYHVYKELSWADATAGEEVKVELETNHMSIAKDPYSCAIRAKHKYFIGWKTVGHIPRELSRYVYFFIKEEKGKVTGSLKSVKYKPSPIPAGGLEVPLQLKFKCPNRKTLDDMEKFVEDFYSFDYTGIMADSEEGEDDIDFEIVTIEPEAPGEGGNKEGEGNEEEMEVEEEKSDKEEKSGDEEKNDDEEQSDDEENMEEEEEYDEEEYEEENSDEVENYLCENIEYTIEKN